MRDLGSEVKESAVEDKSSIYSVLPTSDQFDSFDNSIILYFGKAAGANLGGWKFEVLLVRVAVGTSSFCYDLSQYPLFIITFTSEL